MVKIQVSQPGIVSSSDHYVMCTPLPWSPLSSTPENEEVFHRILWRGCEAIGPCSISPRLFQALVSHLNGGKRESLAIIEILLAI